MAAIAPAAAVVALGGAASPLGAQFTARTDLVEVYAAVTAEDGRPVTNLTADDFTVLEDGVERRIELFVEGEFPLTLAVGVDRSWSMAGDRLAIAKRGAAAAVEGLRPDDAAMVLAIGSRVEVVSMLGEDRQRARDAVLGLTPWGTSPLGDGVVEALEAIQAGTGRLALVLWSDGSERYSERSAEEVREHVRRSPALVYPVAVRREVPALFRDLATLSGGRAFSAGSREEAVEAAEAILTELRHQYLLGYEPPEADERRPGFHAIEVRVRDPRLRVRARTGYVVR